MSKCVNKGKFLLVEVSGRYSLKYLLSTIHEVAEHCRTDKLNKVLIDLRNMEGNPSIFDRFQIGIEIAKSWRSGLQAVAIGPPGLVSRVAENVAVNRGVRLLATTEMEDALKWLDVEFNDEKIGE